MPDEPTWVSDEGKGKIGRLQNHWHTNFHPMPSNTSKTLYYID